MASRPGNVCAAQSASAPRVQSTPKYAGPARRAMAWIASASAPPARSGSAPPAPAMPTSAGPAPRASRCGRVNASGKFRGAVCPSSGSGCPQPGLFVVECMACRAGFAGWPTLMPHTALLAAPQPTPNADSVHCCLSLQGRRLRVATLPHSSLFHAIFVLNMVRPAHPAPSEFNFKLAASPAASSSGPSTNPYSVNLTADVFSCAPGEEPISRPPLLLFGDCSALLPPARPLRQPAERSCCCQPWLARSTCTASNNPSSLSAVPLAQSQALHASPPKDVYRLFKAGPSGCPSGCITNSHAAAPSRHLRVVAAGRLGLCAAPRHLMQHVSQLV